VNAMTLPLFDLVTEGSIRLAVALGAALVGSSWRSAAPRLAVEEHNVRQVANLGGRPPYPRPRRAFPVGALALCAFLSFQGLREFAGLTGLSPLERVLLWGLGSPVPRRRR